MTETRTEYRVVDERLKPAQNRDMLHVPRGEMITLRRRLIAMLIEVESALGCESSIRTRQDRRSE